MASDSTSTAFHNHDFDALLTASKQWTGRALRLRQSGQTSRCPTNISLPTKFSSCKTSPRASAKISSWPFSLSLYSSSSGLTWHTADAALGQISQPSRSPSHSDKEGHCVRGVHGRRERHCGEGCVAQLQVGRRKQNQGNLSSSCNVDRITDRHPFCRLLLRGSKSCCLVFSLYWQFRCTFYITLYCSFNPSSLLQSLSTSAVDIAPFVQRSSNSIKVHW